MEGWGGRKGQRDGNTGREMLDLNSWELVGSGVGTGRPEPPPHHFVVPPDGASGSYPHGQLTGFCGRAERLRASEDKVPQSWVQAVKRNSFPCHLHKAPTCVLKPEKGPNHARVPLPVIQLVCGQLTDLERTT